MTKKLLEVRGLSKRFEGQASQIAIRQRESIWAVKDVDLTVSVGETLGIVGESGSGKTTLARCILQLVRPTTGSVIFSGWNLTELRGQRLRSIRAKLGMVFQDPYSSLNPRWSVERIICDPLIVNKRGTRRSREKKVHKVLEEVGLPNFYRASYPGQLSGGERQRVALARALSLEPELIICDEPTSSLDVSVQAQILNLLCDIQQQLQVSFIFISHDVAVVRQISDRVAVMRQGQIVEVGDTNRVFDSPQNDYTRELLDSVLSLEPGGGLADLSSE